MAKSKKSPMGVIQPTKKTAEESSRRRMTSAAQSTGEWLFSILKASAAEAKSKHKATTAEFGIDVSRWQGDRLNWSQLKVDGVRFAFHRVGSGKTIKDANYNRNVDGCLKHDIPFGNYYFLYEDVDMKQQARLFVQQADWRSTLPPVIDIERNALTAEQVKTFVDEFHRLVDSPPIMIYTSASKWNPVVPITRNLAIQTSAVGGPL